MSEGNLICGCAVEIDRSGQGHAWGPIEVLDIPDQVRLEIEGEIIDGENTECDDFQASNGQHYRWS